MSSELIESYLATDIRITLESGDYLFTDQHPDALAEIPAEFSSLTWFVITGWNPYSQVFPYGASLARTFRLSKRLEEQGLKVFQARGDDSNPASTYPGEEMLAVGLDRQTLERLGEQFFTELALKYEQNSFFKIEGDLVYLLPAHMIEAVGSRRKVVVKLR